MAEAGTRPAGAVAPKESPAAPAGRPAFDALRREVDRLFDSFPSGLVRSPFQAFGGLDLPARAGAMPAVDIAEKDGGYRITAELPGIDEKDIEVAYSDGVVTIRGKKEEAKEEDRKGYHLAERRYGSFQRSFAVPAGVDAGKITAGFDKGVLTVDLPKPAEAAAKEKKIAIGR